MSRALAQLFHSPARLTLDRPAKQALRKLGDHYQNERISWKSRLRWIVWQTRE